MPIPERSCSFSEAPKNKLKLEAVVQTCSLVSSSGPACRRSSRCAFVRQKTHCLAARMHQVACELVLRNALRTKGVYSRVLTRLFCLGVTVCRSILHDYNMLCSCSTTHVITAGKRTSKRQGTISLSSAHTRVHVDSRLHEYMHTSTHIAGNERVWLANCLHLLSLL